jgi:hypothetical protein
MAENISVKRLHCGLLSPNIRHFNQTFGDCIFSMPQSTAIVKGREAYPHKEGVISPGPARSVLIYVDPMKKM